MCYYLATLHLIHDLAPQLHKTASADLAAKFPGVPLQLLDGCLSRFAEPAGKRYTVTEKTRTKLLAWICVVYLSLNDWSIPVGTVASDLKLPPGK
jgi:DNA-directed RNA polymerase I subunit RPA49